MLGSTGLGGAAIVPHHLQVHLPLYAGPGNPMNTVKMTSDGALEMLIGPGHDGRTDDQLPYHFESKNPDDTGLYYTQAEAKGASGEDTHAASDVSDDETGPRHFTKMNPSAAKAQKTTVKPASNKKSYPQNENERPSGSRQASIKRVPTPKTSSPQQVTPRRKVSFQASAEEAPPSAGRAAHEPVAPVPKTSAQVRAPVRQGSSKQGSPRSHVTPPKEVAAEEVTSTEVALVQSPSNHQAARRNTTLGQAVMEGVIAAQSVTSVFPPHAPKENSPSSSNVPKGNSRSSSQTNSPESDGTARTYSTKATSVNEHSPEQPSGKQSSVQQAARGQGHAQQEISNPAWKSYERYDSKAVSQAYKDAAFKGAIKVDLNRIPARVYDVSGEPDMGSRDASDNMSVKSVDFFKPFSSAPTLFLRKDCCNTECTCPPRWSRFPSGTEEDGELQTTAVPLILRNKLNATGAWEITEMAVREDDMKKALEKVFDGYPGFDARLMGDGDWVFNAPFTPFIHRWDRIIAYQPFWADHMDQMRWQHIHDSLESALVGSLKELEQIKETGEVKFDNLWLIYAPGTVVVTEIPPSTSNLRASSAARVLTCNSVSRGNGEQVLQVQSEVFETDGTTSGWAVETWEIPRFEGYRRVDDIGPYYPLDFHPDPVGLTNELHSRGQKAMMYQTGVHYLQFGGSKPMAVFRDEDGTFREGPSVPHMVVVSVDAYYNHCKTMPRPWIRKQVGSKVGTDAQSEPDFVHFGMGRVPDYVLEDIRNIRGQDPTLEAICTVDRCHECDSVRKCHCPKMHTATHWDKNALYHDQVEEIVCGCDEECDCEMTSPLVQTQFISAGVDGEADEYAKPFEGRLQIECLLARGYLGGFDLETKQWYQFPADGLREVDWNSYALDELHPDHPKEMERMHELVRRKLADSRTFDDIVLPRSGMQSYLGRALTFLLAGPHGVGKTVTVQAIASMCQTSVYVTTSDELCNSPGGFQKGLQAALTICQRFQCLLLLEDADALTRRDANCKDHVAMVLQCINQYQGIMFLTASSVEAMPPVLRSRIDQIVEMPDLDGDTRRRIWTKQFEEQGLLQSMSADRLDFILTFLEEYRLDGHEIGNIAKMVPMHCIGGGVDDDYYINTLQKMVKARARQEVYPVRKQIERERDMVGAQKSRDSECDFGYGFM